MLIIDDLEYIPSLPSKIKNEIRGNKAPKSIITNTNRTFKFQGNQPEHIIIYHDEYGNHRYDIYSFLKKNSIYSRITKPYVDNLIIPLIGRKFNSWEEFLKEIKKSIT